MNFIKSTFLSTGADIFVITPNRRTFFFPEIENLKFEDQPQALNL